MVSIENLPESRRLIDVTATLPIALDFLQGDDIGAVDFVGNPLQGTSKNVIPRFNQLESC